MDISKISKRYFVKRITKDNIDEVLKLCLGNPTYYKYCPPVASAESILEDLIKLPPKKSLEDKFYIGFYDQNNLVAVMDLILEYPNPSTIFIGFFMVDKKYQGKGIGSKIIKEVFDSLCYEYVYVRLGYVLGNKQSESFWYKNNFSPTGIVVKEENYSIVILERKLVL